MKPLRTHDYVPRLEIPPTGGSRGLRRILTMFLCAVLACAAICAVLIIRDVRRQRSFLRPATACTCMGACLRH